MPVEALKYDTTTVLLLSNGPVNALSLGNGFVEDIDRSFRTALEDEHCRAIIIAGAGRMFCGGADLADFDDHPEKGRQIRDLFSSIESSDKPVIAAIHGMALGGGLELALAAHYRVATPDARLGLPEVTFGFFPGAGATQRLPRLVKPEAALEMMLSGKSVPASRALEMGLIDELAGDDVVEAALKFANAGVRMLRRSGGLPVPSDLKLAVEARRATLAGHFDEARSCVIEAVSGLTDDLAAGLRKEAELFDALMRTPKARALRHAFRGERRVSRIPGTSDDVRLRSFSHIGVVGGGLMGTGIAITLLNAGLKVTLVEPSEQARARAEHSVHTTISRDVAKGRITQADADARLAGLTATDAFSELAPSDIVIEAVFEDLAVKKDVFSKLDAVVRPDAILASNTSTLDLDAIAALTRDPARVIGLHFFSPANVMRLLEVVRGRETAPDVLATAMALGKAIGKVSVVSGVCDGFIGNRMFEEYLRQVWFMLEEGAMPQQIDRALEDWGMAMGPCRVLDLAGQDIGWAIRKRRAVEQPTRPYSGVVDRVCELGRFGQKTGRGLYLYNDGRTAEPDLEIEQLIIDYSAEIGLGRRSITDAEIVERCLLALINEGARIIDEGIAFRPVDVDMVFLHGYGFARERGGPMFQADLMGLPAVLDKLRNYADGRHGWAWEPAPLIAKLVGEGRDFSALNAA